MPEDEPTIYSNVMPKESPLSRLAKAWDVADRNELKRQLQEKLRAEEHDFLVDNMEMALRFLHAPSQLPGPITKHFHEILDENIREAKALHFNPAELIAEAHNRMTEEEEDEENA